MSSIHGRPRTKKARHGRPRLNHGRKPLFWSASRASFSINAATFSSASFARVFLTASSTGSPSSDASISASISLRIRSGTVKLNRTNAPPSLALGSTPSILTSNSWSFGTSSRTCASKSSCWSLETRKRTSQMANRIGNSMS